MYKQKCPAIFLDRDGVINQTVTRGPDWKGSPRDLHEWQWTKGIQKAAQQLHSLGYLLIVVTNQPEVARKQCSLAQLETLHAHMRAEIPELDDVMICLHDSQDGCDCRKPKPGMLIAATEKWNIDLPRSWMVGDRDKDILAGQAVGCKTCLILGNVSHTSKPDLICHNVHEFAQRISIIDSQNRI